MKSKSKKMKHRAIKSKEMKPKVLKSKDMRPKNQKSKPVISYATIQIGPDTKLPEGVSFHRCIFIIVGGVEQKDITPKMDYTLCKFFESPVGIEVEYWGEYYYKGKDKPGEE